MRRDLQSCFFFCYDLDFEVSHADNEQVAAC